MAPVRLLAVGHVLVLVLAMSGCRAGSPSTPGTLTPAPVATGSTRSGAVPGSAGSVLSVRALSVRLPVALRDAVVFADGTGLLVAGGLTAAGTSTSAVIVVDLPTSRTRSAGRLATAVHDAAGGTVRGVHLVFGGGSTTSTRQVQVVAADGTTGVVGALPQPRSDLAAASAGGYTYLAGGYTGARLLPQVLRTNDGHTFQQVASLRVPVRYPALAAQAGQLWVLGGLTGSGAATDAVQRVDLATGQAEVVGHLPQPIAHGTGFTLGTAVYLAGGQDARAHPLAGLLWVHPDGSATPAGSLPTPLSDTGVATLNDAAYLVGGQTPAPSATIIEIRGQTG